MTLLQAVQRAIAEFPTASILTGVGATLGGLWLIVRAVVNRIVAAFDGMVKRVDAHEAEDTRRFADIEIRANERSEETIRQIGIQANTTTAALGEMMGEIRVLAERREKPR